MDKKKKTKEILNVTVQDVTIEDFVRCKDIPLYQDKTLGLTVTKQNIKKVFPVCTEAFKYAMSKSGILNDSCSRHVKEEEAKQIGIQITGNPRLGIRLYNEEGCERVANSMTDQEKAREFLRLIRCIFHKEEVQSRLYPKTEETEKVTESKSNAPNSEHIICNQNYEDLVAAIAESNKLMNEQVKYNQKLLESLDVIGKSMFLLANAVSKLEEIYSQVNQNTNVIAESEIQPLISEEPLNEFQKLEQMKSNGKNAELILKREPKGRIYKKRHDDVQKYKDNVLHGIPQPLRHNVLNHAYIRMRDVYGVPLDTYKNEYFGDTGKVANSTLDIAHWLEFRNPNIKGLLRCCVEAVLPECNQLV